MPTYTFFYVNDSNVVVSPYFDDSNSAEAWLKETIEQRKENENRSDK